MDAANKQIRATVAVEVVAAVTRVVAPASAAAGTNIEVRVEGDARPQDWVGIFRADVAGVDGYESWGGIGHNFQRTLVAPSTPGTYEIRLVDAANKQIRATVALEVVAAQTSLSAPGQVATGMPIPVSVQGDARPQDWVGVFPSTTSGTDGYLSWGGIGSNFRRDLVAPSSPGSYEVRLVDDANDIIRAVAPLTVTQGTATLTSPESAPAGSSFPIRVSGDARPQDWVGVFPLDSSGADGHLTWRGISSRLATDLKAPDAPGQYEIRLIDDFNEVVRASRPITITAP